ncbi:MAG: Crp/Fnr family transcriptional regulator [Cyanobacteriota bacterium]|nr:Crp/Fnr family transcriptional regulator [Cyanobacteriota bacterium]
MPETEGRLITTNHLLAALPESDFQRLAPSSERVTLARGQVLFEAGEPIQEVYFSEGAAIALVSQMNNGATSAVDLVGKEGLVGLPLFLGGNSTLNQAVVQIPGSALKLDSESFKRECARQGELERLLLLYTQVRLTQVAQTAACRAHHGIEKRLARWLLWVRDCIEQDELHLTQKRIAEMLGVRRASITEAAIALQDAGIIRYTRGRIAILDAPALEAKACECYRLVKSEVARLLSQPGERDRHLDNDRIP